MKYLSLAALVVLAGCAGTNAIRTSQDTVIIQASAAPVCGSIGAAKVAQRQAAIETIKAGFDRYVIVDAASANNVRASQMPGTYHTTGQYGGGWMSAQTTYTPGPVIYSGSHDQSFAVKMFREGEPYAAQAISARETLGPKWQEAIKGGSLTTCT
ncbi:MAG: hypothetical protein KL840_21885 [Aquamicrobium sp.]|nr:hypothetical protein [Aquamicrobium sp.]